MSIADQVVYDWRERAACRTTDPEVFYVADELSAAGREARRTCRAMCTACPVQLDCLDYALAGEAGLTARGRHGFRGGLTPEERTELADVTQRAAEAIAATEATDPGETP